MPTVKLATFLKWVKKGKTQPLPAPMVYYGGTQVFDQDQTWFMYVVKTTEYLGFNVYRGSLVLLLLLLLLNGPPFKKSKSVKSYQELFTLQNNNGVPTILG